jgi:hypothetical protein
MWTPYTICVVNNKTIHTVSSRSVIAMSSTLFVVESFEENHLNVSGVLYGGINLPSTC